jgi:hypothetical protein
VEGPAVKGSSSNRNFVTDDGKQEAVQILLFCGEVGGLVDELNADHQQP